MSNVVCCDLYLRDVEADSVTFTAWDPSLVSTSNPLGIQDLTGWTMTAKVRLTRATVATILSLASGGDITLTPGLVQGNVKIAWTVASKATIRAALLDHVGVWGGHLLDGSGAAHVEIEGDMAVRLSNGR